MSGVAEPSYRKRVGYHGGLLGGFAMLAATFLVIGNMATRDMIDIRKAEDLQKSLNQVIPAELYDNDLLNDTLVIQHEEQDVIVYRGFSEDKVVAVAYSLSNPGYSGDITLIMGVNHKAELLGVRILSHTETPGLGDKIEVEKDDWIFDFDGLSFLKLEKHLWKVKKDGGHFDQMSGATITPRTVVETVREGLELFHANQGQLLADKAEQEAATETDAVTPARISMAIAIRSMPSRW